MPNLFLESGFSIPMFYWLSSNHPHSMPRKRSQRDGTGNSHPPPGGGL